MARLSEKASSSIDALINTEINKLREQIRETFDRGYVSGFGGKKNDAAEDALVLALEILLDCRQNSMVWTKFQTAHKFLITSKLPYYRLYPDKMAPDEITTAEQIIQARQLFEGKISDKIKEIRPDFGGG